MGSSSSGTVAIVNDFRDARESAREELRRQLAFWRERLQIVSNSCRSGAVRERAEHEVQSLERRIADLDTQSRAAGRGDA